MTLQPSTATPSGRAGAAPKRPRADRLNFRLESLIVLLVLCAAMAVLSPRAEGWPIFLGYRNLMNVLEATATIGVLALGATYVISAAGIDLSLGSVLGLSAVAGAYLVERLGLPWPLAIPGCLLAGLAAGAVNGALITRARVPAFIVTLGMLGIARGLALVISNGQAIYGLPAPLVWLGQGRPFGVPMPVIILAAAALVTHYVLAYTRFGKYTLVIGDNETAARAMGVRVERHRFALYAFSGLMAGLAGLLFMTRVNAGDPTAGLGYELTAITAAIIGGTNLFGGRGSILGTILGALIMGVLQNGLNLLAVQAYYQQMAIGAVLVLAVWLDQVQRRDGTR